MKFEEELVGMLEAQIKVEEITAKKIERFEEALGYYEKHRVVDRLAFVLTGLGELRYKVEQPRKALECLSQALSLYLKLGAGKPAELVAAEIAAIEAALEDEKKSVGKR